MLVAFMKVELFTHALSHLEIEAAVLVCFDRETFGESNEFAQYNEITGQLLNSLYQTGEFSGKSGESVLLHQVAGLKIKRLLLMGGGRKHEFGTQHMRHLAGAALRQLKAKSIHEIALVLEPAVARADFTQAATEGLVVGNHETDQHKTDSKRAEKFIRRCLIVSPGAEELEAAVAVGQVVADAQNLARSVGNEPANVLTPMELARRAEAMSRETGLDFELLDRPRMQQLGMGALLGVAQGSAEPPCLIILRYRVSGKSDGPHLAIVGKAVTFDTGGISIKPSEGMEQMKYDMCGGAAALGAMAAIAKLKPGINVTAYIPAVENMPSATAQRPGDIVKSLAGKTIEVLNTDAEGRLILVDAITYAKQNGCTHIVDLATLTGAIGIALGSINTGMFCNDEHTQRQFQQAARDAGEKMWPMPLDDDYKDMLKCAFADMPNIGSKGAGAITAAMFLKEWVENTPWVHLDIAATAWVTEAKPHLAKGPTGVGVRTLIKFVHQLEH
jgi:leucyl aminopeptidase